MAWNIKGGLNLRAFGILADPWSVSVAGRLYDILHIVGYVPASAVILRTSRVLLFLTPYVSFLCILKFVAFLFAVAAF